MADKNNTQLDPILLRMMRAPGRPSPTPGAGAFADNPFLLRQLQGMQPRIMGGSTKNIPGYNPLQMPFKPTAQSIEDILARYPKPIATGQDPQPDVNLNIPIPRKGRDKNAEYNPAIVPYLDMLKEEGAKYGVYVSPAFNTAYIKYGPEGNKKDFTLRVPHPDRPHVGKPRSAEDTLRFIDTAGTELIPPTAKRMEVGTLKNAAGGSFSDPNNVREAIRWQLGKLVPPGSEPFVHGGQWSPPVKGDAFPPKKERTGQSDMLGRMLHKDEKQKIPTILGGSPQEPLSSQSMSQRFNLVTPKDLGNTGAQEYNPMKDPNYIKLLNLVRKYNLPSGND